jgi:hypothetical protein
MKLIFVPYVWRKVFLCVIESGVRSVLRITLSLDLGTSE